MTSRQQHWEKIYKTKDHQKVSWYQESPTISLELFASINAVSSQSVIDVGCGISVLVDHLIEQGYRNITLLDLSQEALSTTRERLSNHGDIPDYLCADITQTSFKQKFDIWHDRAVFHFLTDAEDRKNYMFNLAQSLSRNGHAIIGTFSLNGPNACSGLDIVQYDETKFKAELGDELELIHSRVSTHIMPNGAEQEFQYFIVTHHKT